MIPSNQLRVGNYVLFQDKYCTVAAIFDTDTNENKYPIPLTPEILEACGFVCINDTDNVHSRYAAPNDNNFYLEIDWRRRDEGYNPLGRNYDEYVTIGMNIKHLHQLQNIYFAHTGEELQITINTCTPHQVK